MRSSAVLCLLLLSLAACDTRIVDERSPTSPSPLVVTPITPAPTIALFTAEPSRTFLGGTIVLRWDVGLPASASVNTPLSVHVDPLPGDVPAKGVAVIQPFARGLYTAVLTAETQGGRVSRAVQVIVE